MVKLYSNHCPRCNILKQVLLDKHIEFEEHNNIDEMISKGFVTTPMLETLSGTYDFGQAMKMINKGEIK